MHSMERICTKQGEVYIVREGIMESKEGKCTQQDGDVFAARRGLVQSKEVTCMQ